MRLTLHDPPDGFLAEAEWRIPQGGDVFLSCAQTGRTFRASGPWFGARIVLTPDPALQRPDWLPERLTSGWIAKDESGDWFWFDAQPEMDCSSWYSRGARCCEIPPILIPPDHNPDWQDSLICCEVKS